MNVIGYHIYNCRAANNLKEVSDTPFPFLLQHNTDTIKCFYNLNQAVAALVYWLQLSETELRKLVDKQEIIVIIDGVQYQLFYIPNKYFSVKDLNHDVYSGFSDISQYIPWHFENNQSDEYLIQKAKEAQAVGTLVYEALVKIGFSPKTITSPIRCFEKEAWPTLDVPTVDDLPDMAAEYSYKCCKGNWVEAYVKGYWKEVYDYDINSAYPCVASLLPDTRFGHWVETKGYQVDALFGYCHGELTVTADFNPFLFNNGEFTYTPIGTRQEYLTKGQIDLLEEYSLGKFDIEKGTWWIPDKIVQPLKGIINSLYEYKEQSDGIDKNVVKRILAGIYGKLLEDRGDKFGDHFMPVYGAEIETQTQVAVAEACYKDGIMPLSIAVDGIVTDKPLRLDFGNRIGQWRQSNHCPAIVLGSGAVALADKEAEHDFSLSYDWLQEEINKNPQASTYAMRSYKPMTIPRALQEHKLEQLGFLELTHRTVNVEFEIKRMYDEKPKTGHDLLNKQYHSRAWDISMVQQL